MLNHLASLEASELKIVFKYQDASKFLYVIVCNVPTRNSKCLISLTHVYQSSLVCVVDSFFLELRYNIDSFSHEFV